MGMSWGKSLSYARPYPPAQARTHTRKRNPTPTLAPVLTLRVIRVYNLEQSKHALLQSICLRVRLSFKAFVHE